MKIRYDYDLLWDCKNINDLREKKAELKDAANDYKLMVKMLKDDGLDTIV